MNYDDELLKQLLDYLWSGVTKENRYLIDLLRYCYIQHNTREEFDGDEYLGLHHIVELMVPKTMYDYVNDYKTTLDDIFNEVYFFEDDGCI